MFSKVNILIKINIRLYLIWNLFWIFKCYPNFCLKIAKKIENPWSILWKYNRTKSRYQLWTNFYFKYDLWKLLASRFSNLKKCKNNLRNIKKILVPKILDINY